MCTIETYEFELETESIFHPHSFTLTPVPYKEKKEKVYLQFVNVQKGNYARNI